MFDRALELLEGRPPSAERLGCERVGCILLAFEDGEHARLNTPMVDLRVSGRRDYRRLPDRDPEESGPSP